MSGVGTSESAGARRRRRSGAVGAGCLVAATALLLAGCSSAGGSGSGGLDSAMPSTFATALAEIPSTSWDGSYFEFGDISQVNQLNKAASGSALFAYTTVGASQLNESGQAMDGSLGFDLLNVPTAVTVGQLPHSAMVLYGSFNPSTVGTKLAALGFKNHGSADGGTLWAISDNDKVDMQNPTGDDSLNVLDVSSGRIVLGGSTAEVEAIAAPATTSLATSSKLAAIANCLGSAKAGLIGPAYATETQDSTYVGIGLVASSGTAASEELCVTASSTSAASAIEANWTQRIEHGNVVSLKEPWSKLLTNPQATVTSSSPIVVRLSAQPAAGAKVGVLINDYESPYVDFSNLINQNQ